MLRKLGKHFYFRKPIPNLWGSWNWFSWHRSVVEYVIKEEKTNPRFFKRFHHTYCSDELIFSTLLHRHEKELKIVGSNSLRYINWNKKAEGRNNTGSPLTLNEEEFDEIMESGAFFCRKVHPEVSKKLIEKLRANIKQN